MKYPDRSGMKVSMSGLLTRVASHMEQAVSYPNYSYSLTELLGHLKELGEAFYTEDMDKVDQFLQLYCLDDKREKP